MRPDQLPPNGTPAADEPIVIATWEHIPVLKTWLEHRPAAGDGIEAHRCSRSIAGNRPFANY